MMFTICTKNKYLNSHCTWINEAKSPDTLLLIKQFRVELTFTLLSNSQGVHGTPTKQTYDGIAHICMIAHLL